MELHRHTHKQNLFRIIQYSQERIVFDKEV